MKKRAAVLSLAIIITACNPVVTTYNTNKSVTLSESEIAALDKEYSFSSKALTQNYLKNKLRRWLDSANNGANPDGVKLIKEIEYARNKGESNIPFKALVDSEPSLLIAINNVSEVIGEKAGNVPFRNFLSMLGDTGLPGNIYTVAGIPDGPENPLAANIDPHGVTVDGDGNTYIADRLNHQIKKLDAVTGRVSIIAGTGAASFYGDNGPATDARLSYPRSISLDPSGNLIFLDQGNERVRKIDKVTGVISTVAGGASGTILDNIPATNARLYSSFAIAVDNSGNIFISEEDRNKIRRVDAVTGIITNFAGTGYSGYSGDDSQATAAKLSAPHGIATDSAGNLYIADYSNRRVRKVNAATGIITTFAGTNYYGYTGDGGAATDARLDNPYGVSVDGSDNVYILDQTGHVIRKVNSSGTISTFARRTSSGAINLIHDGVPATDISFSTIAATFDSSGNMYIADYSGDRIIKINPSTGLASTAVSSFGYNGDNIQATSAQLETPRDVAIDSAGNMYIADSENNRIRKVSPSGVITTVAGNGIRGTTGDNGPATAARIYSPDCLELDSNGNIFICDYNRIRKIDAVSGIITNVAGTTTSGFSGDGGQATAAKMGTPYGISFDVQGNMYFVDGNNHCIRKVDTSGIITTVAGTPGTPGNSGEGVLATNAIINSPRDVVVDSAGNIFIADYSNHKIRRVDAVTKQITTFVGIISGPASNADGIPATQANLYNPMALTLDSYENLYITVAGYHKIRKVNNAGIITSVAGTSGYAYTKDGSSATQTKLWNPSGIAVDDAGNTFIADSGSHRIRKVLSN